MLAVKWTSTEHGKLCLVRVIPWNRVHGKAIVAHLLNKFSAFYRTLKFYYNDHKCLLPVHILSQINPVHTILPYLAKIHLNVFLSSMPEPSKQPLKLFQPNYLCISPMHAAWSTHLNLLNLVSLIFFNTKDDDLHMQYSPASCNFLPLRCWYSPQYPVLQDHIN
jgi:hypothetical protein